MSQQETGEKAASRFRILKSDEDGRCATFELNDEDHTLGNAVRHIILKNPEVKFCGYALPHPNERKINIQIQVFSGEAIDALEKGFKDLIELNRVVKEKILEESERFGHVELVGSEDDGNDDDDDDDEDNGQQQEVVDAEQQEEGGDVAMNE